MTMMIELPLAISLFILIIQSAFIVFLGGDLRSALPELRSVRSAHLRIWNLCRVTLALLGDFRFHRSEPDRFEAAGLQSVSAFFILGEALDPPAPADDAQQF
jgi:hypothetical protein